MPSGTINVGMADVQVQKGPAIFQCLGLGSCIGVAVFDPIAGVAGMVHVMLPEEFANRPNDKPGKFANTALPYLIQQVVELGGSSSRLKVAYAGGAQVFKIGSNTCERLQVGPRNVEAVEKMVTEYNLNVIATHVGGCQGRTMIFNSETGQITVRTVTQGEAVLCNIREAA